MKNVYDKLFSVEYVKLSRTMNITNEELLRRMGTGREIVQQFETSKLQLLSISRTSYKTQHISTTTDKKKVRKEKMPWPTKNYLDNGPGKQHWCKIDSS